MFSHSELFITGTDTSCNTLGSGPSENKMESELIPYTFLAMRSDGFKET
jgi:hypothetical protein